MAGKPEVPSFALGYWKPFAENSKTLDSWYNYVRDVSLVEYNASLIGDAIDDATWEITRKMREVSSELGYRLDIISDQLYETNQELNSVNKGIYILSEKQEYANKSLAEISKLLKVPDSEKERLHSINLAIRYLNKTNNDESFYNDALEEFEKALKFRKQDSFVLYNLGLIHLYSKNHNNVKKALEYFLDAAKYADFERGLINQEDKCPFEVNIIRCENKQLLVSFILKNLKLTEKESENLANTIPSVIFQGQDKNEADAFAQKLKDEIPNVIFEIITSDKSSTISCSENNHLNICIKSFSNAALISYMTGDIESAVKFQSKASELDQSNRSKYELAKYLARSKNIDPALENLESAINNHPIFMLAACREIDLVSASNLKSFLIKKINKLNNEIEAMKKVWDNSNSSSKNTEIQELDISLGKEYHVRTSVLMNSRNRYKKYQVIEQINTDDENMYKEFCNMYLSLKATLDDNINRCTELKEQIERNLESRHSIESNCRYAKKNSDVLIIPLLVFIGLMWLVFGWLFNNIDVRYDSEILTFLHLIMGGLCLLFIYDYYQKKNKYKIAKEALDRQVQELLTLENEFKLLLNNTTNPVESIYSLIKEYQTYDWAKTAQNNMTEISNKIFNLSETKYIINRFKIKNDIPLME